MYAKTKFYMLSIENLVFEGMIYASHKEEYTHTRTLGIGDFGCHSDDPLDEPSI